ncbi:MAG: ATP-binding protein [Erysipelotrichaceae bacterium]|nr:ATP-binding protein [Erysipelotrichaceae bacterium]
MEFNRDLYLQRLIAGMGSPLIKVITGIRRSGKSYLLFTLFTRYLKNQGVSDNHIIKIAFDDLENINLREKVALYKHIKSRIIDSDMYYVLLDEIQYVPEFEEVLNSLLHIENADTYVTGSNSRFLSSDIITEFRGRSDEIRVQPLSFREYYEGLGGDKNERLDEYMRFGGLPIVALMNDAEKKISYLKEVGEKIYLSDLKQRHSIKNDVEFSSLLDVLASGIGTLTNPQKLSNTFRSVSHVTITPATISRYLDYYSDSFLISKARRYNVKGKNYIDTPAKYYFADIGLRNARLDFRQVEPTHIMENIIYNELCSRGFQVDVGVVEVYDRNASGNSIRKQLEVDFVVNKGYDRYYIQSAYSYSDDSKRQQETASLKHIPDSFERIIIIGNGGKPYRDENGYRIIRLLDFLLEDSL